MSKTRFQFYVDSILNSYSKVFFAENRLLGILLLLISFLDYGSGLMGLLSVITVIAVVKILKYDEEMMQNGAWGFNSLLIGLGIGIYFDISLNAAVLTMLFAITGFFITLAIWGWFLKYNLPFLSIPFLLTMWIISASYSSLDSFGISERGIYTWNEIYAFGGSELVQLYQHAIHIELPHFWQHYFLSLGAIFFQFSLLAGIIIAFGLLIYSRIAFTLSLIGYGVAYIFYFHYGVSSDELSYTYVGFNFILTAIALGAYYLVPSRTSYFWIVLLLPISVIITLASGKILPILGLPVFSLPFNAVVLLFLYALKLRTQVSQKLQEPAVQKSSPEANLYVYQNNTQRFYSSDYLPVFLPIVGEWHISQGQKGKHTHKGDWQYAWDFIRLDETGEQYKNEGLNPEDYYCFEKPVVAPSAGKIAEIRDGIEDNAVGQINLQQNWGNTIIIEHSPFLYSQLSHLKKDSIKVKEGDFVKKGQVLALVGNSGRSPYPHLHMQFQITPFIGSRTFRYPFAYYLSHKNETKKWNQFGFPLEGESVSNVQTIEILRNALQFKPGQIIKIEIKEKQNMGFSVHENEWQVHTNAYNIPYIYCPETKSYAYFDKDEQRLLFLDFEGNTKSLLYHFFLSFYHIQWTYFDGFELKDSIPANYFVNKAILFFHDFIAPFKSFISVNFELKYLQYTNDFNDENIRLKSEIKGNSMLSGNDKQLNNIEINASGDIIWERKLKNQNFKALIHTH
jgi:urea transporter